MNTPYSPSPQSDRVDPARAKAAIVEKLVNELLSSLPSAPQGLDADLTLHELPQSSTNSQHSYLFRVRDEAQSKILVSMVPLLRQLLRERSVAVREQKLEEMVDFLAGRIVAPTADETTMAQRLAARHTRMLREFGGFTAEQLAEINGSRASNHGALANNWKKRRQVFAVHFRDEHGLTQEVFPMFQFDHGRPIKVIQRILELFGDHKTPWKLALWFTSSNGWLPGQARPVDLLESEPEKVVEAARQEASGSSI